MTQWRIVRRHPRLLRLQPDGRYRGAALLAFGALMLAMFLLTLLGWFGLFAMARDGWGVLGSLALLATGAFSLYAGAGERWGWCELEFAEVAITVVDGFGWRIRHSARIDRPTPGVPLTVVVERDGGVDMPAMRWLSVDNGEPRGRVEIARPLNLSRDTLEQIAAVIERWGRGEPPESPG